MTNLTKQDLERGLELAEKATPGPWYMENEEGWLVTGTPENGKIIAKRIVHECDKAYIVHACNNYPALARQHLALMERCEQLEAVAAATGEFLSICTPPRPEKCPISQYTTLKQALAALEPEGGK